MRIIKTVIRKRSFKAAVAVFVAVAAPITAMLSVELIPDALKLMSEAAKYSGISSVFVNKYSINNGHLILYKPVTDEEKTDDTVDLPVSGEPLELLLNLDISAEKEDITLFTNQSGVIYEETFTPNGGVDYINLENGGQIRNCTDISNETITEESRVPSEIKIELFSDEPQVLILHTHTSESYEPYEKEWYDEEYTSRSPDPANGVVAVGAAIAEELAASGISVIHSGKIHDEMYNGAYSRSLVTAEQILAQYPSIKVILDIHRDAIEYTDGSRVSAVTEINGKKAAQVMIISAADEGTYGIPNFIDNLHFASELQQTMESNYPTLTRPVLFQYCQYNQHLSTGSLLIEVGSHGNTVEQAVYSGHLIGKSLSELLLEKSYVSENPDFEKPIGNLPLYFLERI